MIKQYGFLPGDLTNKVMTWCRSALLLSVGLVSTPAWSETEPILGLREAVDRAVAKNPVYLETNEKIRQSEQAISLQKSTLLPNVNLIGGVNEQKDSANSPTMRFGGDPYNNYTSDLNVKQPLFIYGSFAAVESARKDEGISRLNREIQLRTLIGNVIQAYYQVALTMRNVDTYKREYKIDQESLAVAERRSHTGRGQVLDVLQVKTQLALLKSKISDAENQVATAAATLMNWLSEPNAKVVHVKNVLEAPQLADIDRRVPLTAFRLPELEQNRLQINQIEDQKAMKLGAHLPQLSATGDYYYKSTKLADWLTDTSNSWAAGLSLTIPIFSGFSSRYEQEGLNAQRRALEYERINIENTANLNQVTSRKKLETAAQVLIEDIEALRLATASSDEARRMYRFSTIDFVNFLTVQNAYVQAEQTLDNDKYQYLVALTNYFVATGQDLNKLVDIFEGAAK